MSHSIFQVYSSAVLALLLGACSAPNMSPDADDSSVAVESEIYASSRGLWRTPYEASVTPISVCFENASAYPTEVAWVSGALERSWDAASGIDFTGYHACGSAQIRVRIEDSNPRVEGGLGNIHDKVYLNFTFNNFSVACKATPADREFCIRAAAIHEFGHALGFAHEANRPDSECNDEAGNNGDFMFKYDPDSVMNYCAGYRTALSPLDTEGAKRTYGFVPVTAGQFALQHAVGYLGFHPPINRAPETIGVYTTLSPVAVGTHGGGSTVTYGGQVTIFANGRYFAPIQVWQGSPDVTLGSQAAAFGWRVEPAVRSYYGPTVETREPVTLSSTVGGVKRYLAARTSRGAAELYVTTSISSATEWRFIGPINKN